MLSGYARDGHDWDADEDGQELMAWSANPPDGTPKASQAVQSGLRQAAMTFGAHATIFRSIMFAGVHARVDDGDPELDRALTQILELIRGLHAQLATTIAEHGHDLQQTCESAKGRS
jgi:Family of unknown function (DUF6317)